MVSSAWVKFSKMRSCASGAMPIPVSVTSTRRRTAVSVRSVASTAMVMPPRWVNFSALPTRLSRISCNRRASPCRSSGVRDVRCTCRYRPFCRAWASRIVRSSPSTCARSKSATVTGIRSASIRDRSRMPSISRNRLRAAVRIVSLISAWSGLSGVPSSSAPMPMMALSGVRSSWLTLARNSDFARLAASASRVAIDRRRISASA